MEYRALDGSLRGAEPWSNGPLFGTVWALDGEAVVVVDIRPKSGAVQVAYTPPPRPVAAPPAELVPVAHDVLRRRWLANMQKTWYGRKWLKQRRYDATMPTPEQIAAAEAIIRLVDHNGEVGKIYREGHTATGAVGAARFFDLWKADQPCTETDSSEE